MHGMMRGEPELAHVENYVPVSGRLFCACVVRSIACACSRFVVYVCVVYARLALTSRGLFAPVLRCLCGRSRSYKALVLSSRAYTKEMRASMVSK